MKRKKSKAASKRAAARANSGPANAVEALEIAASSLQGVAGDQDAVKFIDENGLMDEDASQRLLKSCTAISKVLRARSGPITENYAAGYSELMDQYFVFRASTSSVMLLAPVESFRCNSTYTNKKVLGFIRRPGEAFPLMIAFPGWKHCAEAHPRLLDSEIWSENVLKFAENIDHPLQTDGFDTFHGRKKGSSFASHVEPKLLLWFACDLYTRKTKKPPNLKRLHALERLAPGVEVEVIVSEEPCRSCQLFKEEIEMVTKIKVTFKVCKNLATLKSYRDSNGYKRYPAYATEEPASSQTADPDHGYNDEHGNHHPAQLRSSSNIMVVLNSSISHRNSNNIQIRVSSAKKQNQENIETPKVRRNKRQYQDTDDEEEYIEPHHQSKHAQELAFRPSPRTRSSSNSGRELLSPSPSPRHHDSSRDDRRGRVGRGEGSIRERIERDRVERDRIERETAEMRSPLDRFRYKGKKARHR